MSDFEDRLVALDPAAGQTYQHRDLETLITRITTPTGAATYRRWQVLQTRISGVLIAGALVTAGAVAIAQNGSSALPVLALQGTTVSHTPAPAQFAVGANTPMKLNETFDFSVGSGLDVPTPTSPSYKLQVPSSGAHETARLAAAFGVAGTPVNTSDDGVDWSVTNSSGATVNYANSGVPEWSYAAATSSLPTDAPASDLPSPSTLARDVQHFLATIGYGYTLSSPSFGTTTSSDATTMSSITTRDVTYNVDVGGTSTDQTLSFSVDAHNDVVNASGPAFNVTSSLDYPLQSVTEGVSALNAAQVRTRPSPSLSLNAPVANVTLNTESVALETYQLTDGSLWLLPVYEYQGEGTGVDGSTTSGTWYELAIDPTYVHVSANSASITSHGGLKN